MFTFEEISKKIVIILTNPFACHYIIEGSIKKLYFENDLTGYCELLERQGWIDSWDIDENLDYTVKADGITYLVYTFMQSFCAKKWLCLVTEIEAEKAFKAYAKATVAQYREKYKHLHQ